MSKNFVTISRHWHNPQIYTTLTSEGIALNIPLDDFLTAIKQEIGSVAFTVRQSTFSERLDQAVARVLSRIKEESRKVV